MTKLSIKIIKDNGEPVYLSETGMLEDNVEVVVQEVIKFLNKIRKL